MNILAIGMLAASVAGLSAAAIVKHSAQEPYSIDQAARAHTVNLEMRTLHAVPALVGYHSWAKINTTPQYIMSPLDLLCTAPTQSQLDTEKQNPHVRHFMLCYVNSVGEHAMLNDKLPRFPEGTIVLKEKLDSADPGSKPILITAMIKHKAGYDPQHGNWEYVVTNGDGSQLEARGKLANCGGCHAQKKNTDFVFRDEMGADRLSKLK